MRVCVDSSLLVSLYVADPNSPQAVARISLKPEVWLTPLHRAEFAHAVHQAVFCRRVVELEARRVWMAFEKDCSSGVWKLTDFPVLAWHTCVELARRFGPTLGVRTLDTLHVASALELRADRFWTFDKRQAQLAVAAGLNASPA